MLLCSYTAFLDSGNLTVFSAPYDVAKSEIFESHSAAHTEKEKLKKELSKTSRSVQAQVEKASKGKGKLSKRGISNKDHDSKEKINRAKLFGADLADSRKKQILSQRSERISKQMDGVKVKKEYSLGLFFEKIPRVKKLHFEKTVFSYHFLTIDQPEINLEPGQKLAITGDNGAGKSTLLRAWLSKFPYSYAYGPQEFTSADIRRLTDELAQFDKETRGKIMTLVSCLGSDPKSIAAGSIPSPGVWQKIVIARAIIDAVPFLILDEPTNHMDLSAIEVLEEALEKFKGTLICVSHDAEFISKVCNIKLDLQKTSMKTKARLIYLDKEIEK
ncbi:MAG: ATP-binding cassette domain-containing protein [Oligoflexales bacterium]